MGSTTKGRNKLSTKHNLKKFMLIAKEGFQKFITEEFKKRWENQELNFLWNKKSKNLHVILYDKELYNSAAFQDFLLKIRPTIEVFPVHPAVNFVYDDLYEKEKL